MASLKSILTGLGINVDAEVQTQQNTETPPTEPSTKTEELQVQEQSSIIEQHEDDSKYKELLKQIDELKQANQALLTHTTVQAPPSFDESLLLLAGKGRYINGNTGQSNNNRGAANG